MFRKEKLDRLHQVLSPFAHAIARKSWFSAIIVVAVFSTAVVSLAQPNNKDEKAAAKSGGSEVGVSNFGKVTDFYYRGAQPKESEYSQLAALGVKTVIDLRNDPTEYAKPMAEQAGLKYVNLPLDDKSYPASDVAEKFLSLVNDKANWPVYVHCAGGRHRTGAMTAVFRMKVQGWDIGHAYGEMKDYDFYTRWGHKAMKKFVFDYYKELVHGHNDSQKAQTAELAEQANNK